MPKHIIITDDPDKALPQFLAFNVDICIYTLSSVIKHKKSNKKHEHVKKALCPIFQF